MDDKAPTPSARADSLERQQHFRAVFDAMRPVVLDQGYEFSIGEFSDLVWAAVDATRPASDTAPGTAGVPDNLRRLSEAATPGPWGLEQPEDKPGTINGWLEPDEFRSIAHCSGAFSDWIDNSEFIVAAVNFVRDLIAKGIPPVTDHPGGVAEVIPAGEMNGRGNPASGIFDHKWLDPECVATGCHSLLLKQRAERAEELADKYKWQVRDTCVRAEKAEAALAALSAHTDHSGGER